MHFCVLIAQISTRIYRILHIFCFISCQLPDPANCQDWNKLYSHHVEDSWMSPITQSFYIAIFYATFPPQILLSVKRLGNMKFESNQRSCMSTTIIQPAMTPRRTPFSRLTQGSWKYIAGPSVPRCCKLRSYQCSKFPADNNPADDEFCNFIRTDSYLCISFLDAIFRILRYGSAAIPRLIPANLRSSKKNTCLDCARTHLFRLTSCR